MDPLSIAASIAGLIAISISIRNALSVIHELPRSMKSIVLELESFSVVLRRVQQFILDADSTEGVDHERLAIIQLHDLIVSLSGCVCIFSQLENIVKTFFARNATRHGQNFAMWSRLNDSKPLLEELQKHKLSLSLVLNIMTCESVVKAEKIQRNLEATIQELVESNRAVSIQLKALISRHYPPPPVHEAGDQASIRTSDTQRTSFTAILRKPRVYRSLKLWDGSIFTISTTKGTRWSGLADLSQISNISVFELPIFKSDLSEFWNTGMDTGYMENILGEYLPQHDIIFNPEVEDDAISGFPSSVQLALQPFGMTRSGRTLHTYNLHPPSHRTRIRSDRTSISSISSTSIISLSE